VPAWAQLVITEAIVDELLAGDLRALEPLIVEDTRKGLGRVQLVLVKTLGAGRALAQGPRAFRSIYERGTAEVEVKGRSARTAFVGNPLFGHPTWRALQLMATRTLLELAGTPGDASGEDLGADAFAAVASW
jgi:hypothetical protein